MSLTTINTYLISSTNNSFLDMQMLRKQRETEAEYSNNESNFYWNMLICVCVPAGGSCEAGSVVDRRYGLVHQWIRLNECKSLIREICGGLIASSRAITSTGSRPRETEREGKKTIDFYLHRLSHEGSWKLSTKTAHRHTNNKSHSNHLPLLNKSCFQSPSGRTSCSPSSREQVQAYHAEQDEKEVFGTCVYVVFQVGFVVLIYSFVQCLTLLQGYHIYLI